MNYDETAIKFLATEENLPMALEIAGIVERMKGQLHREFWQGLQYQLNQRLASSEKFNFWEADFNQGSIEKFNKDWFAFSFVPSYIEENQHYFKLFFQQGSSHDGYPLFYGLARSHTNNRAKETGVEEVSKLSRAIQKDGFQYDAGWWFGFKHLDYACTKKNFLLRMANEKELFINEMAHMMWNFFETHYALLEDANKALARVE